MKFGAAGCFEMPNSCRCCRKLPLAAAGAARSRRGCFVAGFEVVAGYVRDVGTYEV